MNILLTFFCRPTNREELYNLRHAQARNVIECIFGIVKERWVILIHLSQFDMDVQARIPPALAAIHNFIREHDPDEIREFADVTFDPNPGFVNHDHGTLANGRMTRADKERADVKRDEIAQGMWEQYQEFLQERGEDAFGNAV